MPSPQKGDEGELFERYHRRLLRLTAHEIKTSHANIEEACAFAWAQLLSHEVRRDSAFAWLRQVARREAMRLRNVDRGVLPLGYEPGTVYPEHVPLASGNPAVTPERWREALARLDRLPERDRLVPSRCARSGGNTPTSPRSSRSASPGSTRSWCGPTRIWANSWSGIIRPTLPGPRGYGSSKPTRRSGFEMPSVDVLLSTAALASRSSSANGGASPLRSTTTARATGLTIRALRWA
jgi:hypothetical protein